MGNVFTVYVWDPERQLNVEWWAGSNIIRAIYNLWKIKRTAPHSERCVSLAWR